MLDSTDTGTKSYFDKLYSSSQDPYGVKTRWYEIRKRDLILASLPRKLYKNGFEPGCGIGDLSGFLSSRCESLLCSDADSRAVKIAANNLADLRNVRVVEQVIPAQWPISPSGFDLIIFSEILYFMSSDELNQTIAMTVNSLTPESTLLLCNWKHDFSERRISTRELVARFESVSGLHRVVKHEEEDFLLEVFSFNPTSVARMEGIV